MGFFDIPSYWEKIWKGMPEFYQENLEPFQTIMVHFSSPKDRKSFSKLIYQNITKKTKSIWYPKKERNKLEGHRYFVSEKELDPHYPIYIISKGRWKSRLTSKALERLKINYSIVIEPQEYKQYAKVIDSKKILVLPFSNLGKGSIPARNWVWEHSIKQGAAFHWILDDNIRKFFRLYRNVKYPIYSKNIFYIVEDFVNRYENIALAGFNYREFPAQGAVVPPFYLNTRIYSCILIRNDLSYRWRGKYNEDTDLSLRILKDGWCTILFNMFLADKMVTMMMKGGNTDELYKGDGRLEMARSLQKQHPDVAKVVYKYNRWHHHVDYRSFKKNKLKLKGDMSNFPDMNNYGLYLKEKA